MQYTNIFMVNYSIFFYFQAEIVYMYLGMQC